MNTESNGNGRKHDEFLPPKPPAFKIDAMVRIEIAADLAIEIGDLIIEAGTENKALWAFGKQLQSLGD